MSKAEHRQLTFAFADSPQGDGPVVFSDVSVGKAWLAHQAEVKEGKDSAAWTVDPGRLLQVSYKQRLLFEGARQRLEEPDV